MGFALVFASHPWRFNGWKHFFCYQHICFKSVISNDHQCDTPLQTKKWDTPSIQHEKVCCCCGMPLSLCWHQPGMFFPAVNHIPCGELGTSLKTNSLYVHSLVKPQWQLISLLSSYYFLWPRNYRFGPVISDWLLIDSIIDDWPAELKPNNH